TLRLSKWRCQECGAKNVGTARKREPLGVTPPLVHRDQSPRPFGKLRAGSVSAKDAETRTGHPQTGKRERLTRPRRTRSVNSSRPAHAEIMGRRQSAEDTASVRTFPINAGTKLR